MHFISIIVLAFPLLFNCVSGQFIQNGQCDFTPELTTFNLDGNLGTWYELARSPSERLTADCSQVQITNDNETYAVHNRAVNRNFLQIVNGTLEADGSANLTLNLNVAGEDQYLGINVLMNVEGTYVLAYRCENLNNARNVYIWLLGTSTAALPDLVRVNINVTLNRLFGVSIEDLRSIDHSGDACYELSVIEEGEPIILDGQCDPNISAVQNFNAVGFLGLWHELWSYESESVLGTCARAEYSLVDGTITVLNSEVRNQTLGTISGTAILSSTDNSGRLLVTLEVIPGFFVEQELVIIDTDYDSYAISYSCQNVDNSTKRVFSWILGRSRELTEESQAAVNEAVNSVIDLNFAYYQPTRRTDDDCFYFPEPVSGQPVVFRGQCDPNITVVDNFDAALYMGLWYDISSYPSIHQAGTCNNAQYTLNDGFVDVLNTQVINEALDSIEGVAVPEDGGKLIVTFPIPGTNLSSSLSYWVLATNYESYAIVYSCENNGDDRQVWSWKLSRSKQLSQEDELAINQAISDIPVLNEMYYEEKDQSADGCFYYPEAEAGVPVVFPGQCDESIEVVENFNFTQFGGVWYEIEAYPKDEQNGQCISHDYSSDGSLTSISIADQFMQTSNAIVSYNDTGKLEITMNAGNSSITIPFWILATDYDEYALAYSCINVNSDFRSIYSWKLSRTKALSPSALEAINNATQNIQVLNNTYYEEIDQTNEACFYLPDIPPGEPIILVGYCESNISVVQNFSAAQYAGLWHVIESYTADSQIGTCNDVNYSIENNSILVVSTQVINETLDSLSGVVALAEDGSGKLVVTYLNETKEFWILDTDYETYSIVYSCEDISTESRRVWSWKLSRSTELTANATTAINEVVDSINVLNNRYFQQVDNSDEGCFYFPEPNGLPVLFRGQCDENITVVTNFSVGDFLGTWFDLESYPQFFQEGTCSTARYSLGDEGVIVFNTQVENEALDSIEGLAVVASDDNSAKLSVTFPILGVNISSPYWVLATDYNNYALIYSCSNIGSNLRSVISWKLSREKSLSQTAVTAINNVINNVQVLRQDYYVFRNHTPDGCFYYPEPVLGQTVIFPGQCEDTIQAVSDFDISRFTGVWHELEAYPKDEVQGNCINYDYTDTSNSSLLFYNNQVVDQFLVTNNGTSQLASSDGSGVFTISINTNGTVINIPYWILSTNYDDYALAYSCINIDAYFRRVFSWKLSRSKELSSNATSEINSVISDIRVLGQQYFEQVNQTDAACFYYPELGPTDPVVFVGQCDQTIAAVPNFRAGDFAGRWFEIESYFDGNEGTCVDSTLAAGANGFNITFTKVVNEALESIFSEATFAVDGSGKFIATSNNVTSEYWILDTDYTSYALVYSCYDIDSDSREVRSWKLSRSRTLANESSIAIESTMDNINVLDAQYYNQRNQSSEACFYYPEPIPGQSVRFRRLCDENIFVVQDFNLTEYLGVWYDIERYPQAFQDGSCSAANYELGSDGVLVRNTQVRDQQLDVINGTAVLASDDGSAKLSVSFPIAGTDLTTSSPYWVLATDYINYALVYSCTNIDDEYSTVTSWKLSRSKNLTEESEIAINAVMETIPVLNQDYFVLSGHSEEDCFFYPDNYGGPVILDGNCPAINEVDAVTNFNAAQFSGTWHEIARFPSESQDGECVAIDFQAFSDSFGFTQTVVYNERLNTNQVSGELSADGRGVLNFTISGLNLVVYVLDTDYEEYALLYGCVDISEDSKQIFSWKLGKSRASLSEAANERIDSIVSNNIDLFERYYKYTDQSNNGCFYYPEFETLPSVIELPGPCDESIQGVSNFAAADYLGRWFEIEKYPQPFQTGTCSRAEYSLVGNSVQVLNTQVVNRTLDTIIGAAEVSPDGTGLLNVTFEVNGVILASNYYVLETNYTDYALVYGCQNLPNGNRLVSSWKLSRTGTLSNAANTIINQGIARTQGLIQDYYIPTSQTAEDCFYVPESEPLFRGQCEDVTGVPNFNIEAYLGWWHEIESYQTNDAGECTSSQFSSTGTNQYQVVDTSVIGLSGDITASSVQATADGRLRRTLSNGQVRDTWVLATDYTTYSLLYSCENVNDEYRRVWSAKHSKARELTSAAQAAMDAVIAPNDLLHDHLYLPVDQSDSACFHYPIQDGQRVIMPGQCDQNIPVVTDFDAGLYTGIWYQIERYPQAQETGYCSGARYSLGPDDTVQVTNWQITDEEVLDVVEGSAVISSTDGSARLMVTLPIVGTNETVTTQLFVLATDYISYSLTYNCINVNQFQRSVSVWKLSRTRTMSAAANTAINAYMSSREEIHQPYFISVEQDEECEEPNSGLLIKSSLIVVLVCAVLQVVL